MGELRASRGDLAGAEAAFQRALALYPGHHATSRSYAELLSNRGRHQEAEDMARRLLDVASNDARMVVLLGLMLMQRGEQQAAAEQFRRALELAPQSTAARRGLEQALAEPRAGSAAGVPPR
jgi:Flp pilus assembly protein TadD